MHDLRIKPESFTDAELEAARGLRLELADILPPDYDTDFCLARWHKAYKGDKDAIRSRLMELLEHRQTIGYNTENIVESCSRLEFARKTFERFAISSLKLDTFSDDVAVFVQKMEGADLKEIVKIMPLSNVIHSYYLLHEAFQRAMLEHEKCTGRPSGVVVLLDLRGMCITDFLNPLSSSTKLARLVVKVWSEYYSENMIKLLLVHPPGLLSIMWKVAKNIVDAKTQSRIAFIPKIEELRNYLADEAIPEEFDGTRRDDSGFAPHPETCVRLPLPIRDEEHFRAEKFWKEHGFSSTPDLKTVTIRSNSAHEVTKECRAGQILLWQFTVNCDVTFDIAQVHKQEENDLPERVVWPKITLTSLKTPEHGFIKITETGTYRLRFLDVSSSWLASKLNYTVQTK
jgi:hypothetical protein